MFLDSIYSVMVGFRLVVLFLFYSVNQYFNLPFNFHQKQKFFLFPQSLYQQLGPVADSPAAFREERIVASLFFFPFSTG